MDIIKNLKLEKNAKQELINQRLENYKRRIYDLYLDYVAYEAAGDQDSMKETKSRIEYINKAIDAVEKIKVEG